MKKLTRKGFTLVELLVVITILAIISVVAYQNFGGAVDKAVSGRKISDVATIETSLQQYKVDKSHYPAVDEYNSDTNIWGYNSSENAFPSNTLIIGAEDRDGAEIKSISGGKGGGKVMGIKDWSGKQIGAKGTISQATLGKQYLTKDLYDPELGDIKVGKGKMVEHGVGRYVYATFKKPLEKDTTWTENQKGSYYNIAYTIKVDGSDKYITKVVGDYDNESCFDEKEMCTNSLIGSGENTLKDNEENSSSSIAEENQGIPYPVSF